MRASFGSRGPLHGEFSAPASKPQTQRALIIGSLADGLTTIHHPLMARETLTMIEACRSLGAAVSIQDDQLTVRGIGSHFGSTVVGPPTGARYVWASGSALVARLFLSIGSAFPEVVVIDGKCNLRARPFEPLTTALRQKGVELRAFDTSDRLPYAAVSSSLPGGRYRLGTDVSSQFATSLLISAPLATSPVDLELTGPSYSISYLRQTAEMMAQFGVAVAAEDDMRQISVSNEKNYQAQEVELTGDYTSASYIVGAAFVTRGAIQLNNLDPGSLQGERAMIDIIIELGARVRWIEGTKSVLIDCTNRSSSVDVSFDLSDCPNILPTVAAIAATVPGRVRITGGRLTQNHKSPRIDAIAAQLGRAGVSVQILKSDDGFVDGLEVSGKERHEGGILFPAYEDHRIIMATVLFTLACSHPCAFEGTVDTVDSFPGFAESLGLTVSPA
jgi:3-phosphoshikimate 1-carboxyvinyltransferase